MPSRDWRYRGVDAELARALNARAAVTGRDGLVLEGRAPTGARALKLTGVAEPVRKVLEAAGYREPAALRTFDVGHLGDVVAPRELDEITRAAIEAEYAAYKVPTKTAKVLAGLYVRPVDFGWAIYHCGDMFGNPHAGNVVKIPPDIADRLRPREIVDLGPVGPRPDERLPWVPGGGWTDPIEDGPLVDLTRQVDRRHRLADIEEIEQLIALSDQEVLEQSDRLARGAEAALTAGENELALRAAGRLMQVRAGRGGNAVFAHLQSSVAPAIALAASRDEPWTGAVAARALRSSPAGLSVTNIARTIYLRDRRRAVARLQRVAATGPARGRGHRARAAADELARVALGLDADGKGVSAALTTQSLAAVTDLARALYATTVPKETATFPATAPAGVAGRSNPAAGWFVGAGGLSARGPGDAKAISMHAFGQAAHLECLDVPLLGGDLFRFDWLLDEVRATVEQLEHLDVLLLGLIAQLADLTGDITALAGEAMDAIAKLVEQIRAHVDRVASELQRTLGEVLKAATSAAVLLGVLRVIGDWKWDQWIAMFGVIVAAVGAGSDPFAAVDNWIIGQLSAGIAAGLAPAIAEFTAFGQRITADLAQIALPSDLIAKLETLLATSGLLPSGLTPAQRTARAQELLAPIIAARDAAVNTLTAELTAATQTLTALATTTVFSPELRALVFAYLVTPLVVGLVAAAVVVIGGGPLGMLAIIALGLIGIELIERVVVGVIVDLTGIVRNLQATAQAGLAIAGGLLTQLRTMLSELGGLEAVLDALTAKINQLADALAADEIAELQTHLLAARDAIRGQLTTLLAALDRSFFRETLTAVAQPGELALHTPERPPAPSATDPNRLPELASLYRDLTVSTQLASLLPRYEATRVAAQALTGIRQTFTHVLSLKDILGLPERTTPVGSTLQTLLQANGKLPFSLGPQLFDRVAPGAHGLLVKDIALQFDFEVPPGDEQAMTALLGALGAAAGGTIDPALVARTAGFGMPGLPIVPARVPTGVPAVLSSGCVSYVRLSPPLAAPLIPFLCEGECGESVPVSERPPSLANVELLDDSDPGAQAAGYRMLALHDRPQSLMFSHFELLADGVRFIVEPKQLKAFENRGIIGHYELEIPAIVRQFVTHALPAIRDVRLIVSSEGQWSSELADALTAPAAATAATVPRGPLPKTIDDLIASVGDLLDATNLQTLVALGRLQLPSPATPGNLMLPLPLDAGSLPNAAQVLLGTQDAVFDVTAATLLGMGLDPTKVVALREVRVGLLPGGPVLGATLPQVPVTVGYRPTAAATATTKVVNTANGAATVPLGQIGNPTTPIGLWSLRVGSLPATTTLASAGLILVVETLP